MQEYVATNTPYAIEYRILHRDGTVRWVFENGVPIAEHQQQPLWLDGVILDITELKQAQQHNEELERKFLQAQKMESVGRLAGGVAHDFNNMLGVIIGNTEIALDKLPADNPVQTELAGIKTAAERSAALTQQLLAFARKQIYAPKILDLNATVAGMLPMLRRLIGEDIDLAWLPGSDGRLVKMDPTQIEQILANLCVNARDAIVDTGKLTIETGTAVFDHAYCAEHPGFVPGSYVLLAVSDNGSGMTDETLGQLFEPFFTTKELGKGTGLGLATVYGIVKQNNGFINVYSEVGQGTTFRIYLVRHEGEIVAVDNDADTVEMVGGQECILLVEDEPMLNEMTTMMLERQGYAVLPAATPSEAMRLAGEHGRGIDLLITDVVMPEMNGRELASRLADIVPRLKCLFVSGYTANVIAHHGVLDEGVHFMQKPFSSRELAAKVREVLEAGDVGSRSG
jgi:two-component system, cell cycle sensor histidine kinase and response regulator CckA